MYDEMSERSYPGYRGRYLARSDGIASFCERRMEGEGFNVYNFEWWHFDYKDWREYPVLNLTFDQISPAPASHASLVQQFAVDSLRQATR